MKNGVNALQALKEKLPRWACSQEWLITPVVGGLSNQNWKLFNGQKAYFVKQFAVGSEAFIDREASAEAQRRAEMLDLAPHLVQQDRETGIEISVYLEGYRPSRSVDFLRDDFLSAAVEWYRRFNTSPPLRNTKHIFAMTDEHLVQSNGLRPILPAAFDFLLSKYEQAKAAFMASGLDLAPCHNDPMPGNFMVYLSDQDHRLLDMKMVDYEFASNNERAYELGVFLGEVFVDEMHSQALIEAYYGVYRDALFARVQVARAVADFKWGCWAVQQRQRTSWDFDYQKYGIWKFARARALFEDDRWEGWLSRL
ncbi:hypothetical protein LMG33818_000699 [Halomonadaceae bacterium LMG 33818]|uniref:phosphotransferase n=1 Tax=Cernens ardua TaxID=3402176 RepID=UPI003EDC09BC